MIFGEICKEYVIDIYLQKPKKIYRCSIFQKIDNKIVKVVLEAQNIAGYVVSTQKPRNI